MGKCIRDGVQKALDVARFLQMSDTDKSAVMIGELMAGLTMSMAWLNIPKDQAMQMFDHYFDVASGRWSEKEEREGTQ